jgi:defect-in-organelle-trafficking protein DotB
METADKLTFPDEPDVRWESDVVDRLLLWATAQGASDVEFISADRAWIRLHGHWAPVTRRRFTANELFANLDKLSQNLNASSALKSAAADLDFPYEVERARGERIRFRCNACAISDGGGYSTGMRLVLRLIPSVPPALETLNLEPELVEHLFPQNGLVLITGTMGSGKTTLIFSALRHIAERGGRHVLTFEEPVEFNLHALASLGGPVSQCQVPEHLGSFMSAVRNCTRAAPDVVLVGESRDPETLRGMLEASEIGVAAYSTVHTRSVPETLSRIINVFAHEEHNQIKSTLLHGLRLIVQQRLLPAADGNGRVAAREFLAFTPEVRELLISLPPEDLPSACERLLVERGQPLQTAAQKLFDAGRISKLELAAIVAERRETSRREDSPAGQPVPVRKRTPGGAGRVSKFDHFLHDVSASKFQSTADSIRRLTPPRRIGAGWIVPSMKGGATGMVGPAQPSVKRESP